MLLAQYHCLCSNNRAGAVLLEYWSSLSPFLNLDLRVLTCEHCQVCVTQRFGVTIQGFILNLWKLLALKPEMLCTMWPFPGNRPVLLKNLKEKNSAFPFLLEKSWLWIRHRKTSQHTVKPQPTSLPPPSALLLPTSSPCTLHVFNLSHGCKPVYPLFCILRVLF